MIVGIDSTRNRSGGAIGHIKGLLQGSNPQAFNISKVHLWAYKELADSVPDFPWLIKHIPHQTEQSIIHQIWWQFYHLPREAKKNGCELLYNTDAGSVCYYPLSATLSQDLLSFEPGEICRYGLSKARLRLVMLKYIQKTAFKKANLTVFLTDYAKNLVEKQIGRISSTAIIPHGIDDEFFEITIKQKPGSIKQNARLVYVSNTAPYKHHDQVLDAVSDLRARGWNVYLTLIGGGKKEELKKLNNKISKMDPTRSYIQQFPFLSHEELIPLLDQSDIYVFASSCENMPITLLEGMAVGLPIACSDRGPMPEILKDAGIYFNPECPQSISKALELLITDFSLRENLAEKAFHLAKRYSWARCSSQTWSIFSQLIALKEQGHLKKKI